LLGLIGVKARDIGTGNLPASAGVKDEFAAVGDLRCCLTEKLKHRGLDPGVGFCVNVVFDHVLLLLPCSSLQLLRLQRTSLLGLGRISRASLETAEAGILGVLALGSRGRNQMMLHVSRCKIHA